MIEKKLTGKIPRERIEQMEVPAIDAAILNGYRALGDMTGAVSDALDELGVNGVVPSSVLKPTIADARIVGPALTLRNVMQQDQPYKGAKDRISRMAEIEAHNLAVEGNVLVIEGVDNISNMGGISATIALRQGEVGAIVDGGIRDVNVSKNIGFPLWSKSVSSITGKWRVETVAINGCVNIGGVQVRPGDLVVADEGAVCFVPKQLIELVLKRAREITDGEELRYKDIDAGVPVVELAQMTHVYKFDA